MINQKGNAKKILVTGAAGFIGFHLSRKLLEQGFFVTGYDNLNDYYEVTLKEDRLRILENYKNFTFIKGDVAIKEEVDELFQTVKPDYVIHLAAQAGVRYSIENPKAYMDSNITGFFHILEALRIYGTKHLVYASSSSVYGANKKIPFSTEDKTDQPVSFYAVTKKTNELMAYTYSHLYQIPATGLRFFTVYGPYGRPDMAYFSFAKSIWEEKPIKVFNNGNLYRDFTYIDDIVEGMVRIMEKPPVPDTNQVRHKVYNIGNHRPENLMDFIRVLENCLGKKAKIRFYPMQDGDVYQTCADVADLKSDFDFYPDTPMEIGLKKFTDWYLSRYERKISDYIA
ncbi:MAG: putative protein in cld 5'region [Lachnoclostridium sp.]|jgi:UDP-glucuronate 4-epimerase